jgi:MFS family permease
MSAEEAVASRGPFAVRDFRLLWAGQAVSVLGDQFALIALPWLALVMTGSPFALGGVLAVMAVPRAVLMLLGGVVVDRWSPRRVMGASNVVRLCAVTVLAAVVLSGHAEAWMLYAFGLVFGVADAFFYPAATSMLPTIVGVADLPRANAVYQGTNQLSTFVGPAVAGLLIAALGSGASGSSTAGISVALLLDGGSFLVSLVTLALMSEHRIEASAKEPVVSAIRSGIDYVLASPSLRMGVLLVVSVNLLIVGPLNVGLPVLVYSRLDAGAAGYGALMSGLGGGSLLGIIAAGLLPTPRPSRYGPLVVAVMALIGVGFAMLALVPAIVPAVALTTLIGLALGYANLSLITWTQQRVPKAYMGRVMSLLLLGSFAMVPVSSILAGALLALSLSGLLIAAGVLMIVVTLTAASTHAARDMGLVPVVESRATA